MSIPVLAQYLVHPRPHTNTRALLPGTSKTVPSQLPIIIGSVYIYQSCNMVEHCSIDVTRCIDPAHPWQSPLHNSLLTHHHRRIHEAFSREGNMIQGSLVSRRQDTRPGRMTWEMLPLWYYRAQSLAYIVIYVHAECLVQPSPRARARGRLREPGVKKTKMSVFLTSVDTYLQLSCVLTKTSATIKTSGIAARHVYPCPCTVSCPPEASYKHTSSSPGY